MRDYASEIAGIIKGGGEVIFYTLGSGTLGYIRELKHRFGLLPTAVCDGDGNKQNRTYRALEGLGVISPEEALSRFPEAQIFIPSLDYRYQIIGYLTETCSVKAERILNYTPVKKIRSCSFLQKALIYDETGDLRFCWRTPCPTVPAGGGVIKAGELLRLRNGLIEAIKRGESLEHTACGGCPQIREEYYPQEPLSWSVNYFCHSTCNFRCSYCTLGNHAGRKPEREDGNGRHALGEVIGAFTQAGLLSEEHGVILSTAGEPLIHPQRKEFFEAFQGSEMVVNTNGSLFDENLFAQMGHKRILMVVSVDAGTRETYARIKGVDAFERTRENLKRYAEAPIGMVALKYIFVPGVNDKVEDIDGMLRLCEETGVHFVILSLDY